MCMHAVVSTFIIYQDLAGTAFFMTFSTHLTLECQFDSHISSFIPGHFGEYPSHLGEGSENAAHIKCQIWLSTSSDFPLDFPGIEEIPQFYKQILRLDAHFAPLPCLMKSLVGSITYCAHISTSHMDCANSKPIHTNISDSLKVREKTLDVLMSNFHTLELKKYLAQAEVKMFFEAISRTAGFQYTNSGNP
ncbi:hypothetical protein BDR04DRAFT_1214895 [Suillus decipiens]|nr:hypothetical protein BDR04DRAFT_1214895 [Suillus decipiens]